MEVARVQDSATGAFLSADNLISDPGYTQSYNRYGYVNNNPLSYNDPSGHCPSNNGTTPPDNGTPPSNAPPSDDDGSGEELEEVVVTAELRLVNMMGLLESEGEGWGNNGDYNYNMGAPANDPTPASPDPCPGAGATATNAQGGPRNSTVINYSDGSIETRSGGARSWRNNNPGNIIPSPFSTRHGSIGSAGGFSVFPNEGVGTSAQLSLLKGPTYQAFTVDSAVIRWSKTDQSAYQAFVEKALGVTGDTTLSTLTGDQINTLANAQRKMEGWREGTVSFTCPIKGH